MSDGKSALDLAKLGAQKTADIAEMTFLAADVKNLEDAEQELRRAQSDFSYELGNRKYREFKVIQADKNIGKLATDQSAAWGEFQTAAKAVQDRIDSAVKELSDAISAKRTQKDSVENHMRQLDNNIKTLSADTKKA